MNIWDSVHRGLERASQEAARIAKIQRLRSTIDGLQRQVSDQYEAVVARTMQLFATGQLTQGELLSLCQEMVRLQQQLSQAQVELKQVQSQGTQVTPPGTMPPPAPPPPPGVEPLALGTPDTIAMNAPEPTGIEQRYCSVCYTELVGGNAFCHHCGTPVANVSSDLPTTRGSIGASSVETLDTVRIQSAVEEQAAIDTPFSAPPLAADSSDQDGGQ